MIRVLGSSHYFQATPAGSPLPDLQDPLKGLCRESYRRIDRFIQLSLLGSARCVQGRALRPDCALYLSSSVGPVENNILVQETLFRDLEIPKPFQFVSTLGSSAGYYVCKNLGLSGSSLFISRKGAAIDAALRLARVDLELGIVDQALVGVVEESTLPLPLLKKEDPGEESHWLLLERCDGEGGFENQAQLDEFINSIQLKN